MGVEMDQQEEAEDTELMLQYAFNSTHSFRLIVLTPNFHVSPLGFPIKYKFSVWHPVAFLGQAYDQLFQESLLLD
jgi:hypothetical protein